ncbi:uncharacterized protein LOC144927581 [Branchiostoma floridae x Branchiostoma belcheri]
MTSQQVEKPAHSSEQCPLCNIPVCAAESRQPYRRVKTSFWAAAKMLFFAGFVLALLAIEGSNAQGNFWETEKETCIRYGRTGDCAFYGIPCLEKKYNCMPVGFPVGYGYRFCMKITEHFEEFDADGKAWISAVRNCLTKALIPIYKTEIYTCPTLETFGLKTYPKCFTQTKAGGGLCKVVQTNKDALINVWGATGTQGALSSVLLEEILVASQMCTCYPDQPGLKQIVDSTSAIYTKVLEITATHWGAAPKEGTSPACETKALEGDCSFYDCFEKRFPCGRTQFVRREGQSLCEQLVKKAPVFNTKGQDWVTAYTKCMTRSMLALYNEESLSCRRIRNYGFRSQFNCLIDTDICDLVENRQNVFALWYILDVVHDWRFHEEMSTVLCRCHKYQDGSRYTLRYSGFQQAFLKQPGVVVDQSSSADSQCTGKCQDYTARTCLAGYEDGKCGGNALRKCCLPCDASCQSTHQGYTSGDTDCSKAGGQCKMDSNYCHGQYQEGLCGGPAGRKCCIAG